MGVDGLENVLNDIHDIESDLQADLLRIIESGQLDDIAALLDAGAQLNHEGIDLQPPLAVASQSGNAEIVKYLLIRGADVNYVTRSRNTALMWATRFGYCDCARALIDGGANVNQVTGRGTALNVASRSGDVDMITLLLDRGADINIQTRDGLSPLMEAVLGNHPEAVRTILRAGVNSSQRDIEGRTSLDIAQEKQYTECVWVLAQEELVATADAALIESEERNVLNRESVEAMRRDAENKVQSEMRKLKEELQPKVHDLEEENERIKKMLGLR